MRTILSRHFTLEELACKCGECTTHINDINANLIYQLQKLRDNFGLPINIASGYRCEKHNEKIGGAKHSQHLQGRAVDISTKNLSAADKYRLIQQVFRLGSFHGVGIGGNKLHVDVRLGNTPVFWFYS